MEFFIFYYSIIINTIIYKLNATSNTITNDTIVIIIKKDLMLNFNYLKTSKYNLSIHLKHFVLLSDSTLFGNNVDNHLTMKSMFPQNLRLKMDNNFNQKLLHSVSFKNNFKIITYALNEDSSIYNFSHLFRHDNHIKFVFFITNVNQQVELFRFLIKESNLPHLILNLNRVDNYNFNSYDPVKVRKIHCLLSTVKCVKYVNVH